MMSLLLLQGGVTIFVLWYSAASRRSSMPDNSSNLLVAIVAKMGEVVVDMWVCAEVTRWSRGSWSVHNRTVHKLLWFHFEAS